MTKAAQNIVTLHIDDRQKVKRIAKPFFRSVVNESLLLLASKPDFWQLCFHLVDDEEMTELNEHYLQHEGSTDVITFDQRDELPPGCWGGEVFICVNAAVRQAREFRTTWQAEVVRYAVHGILHLMGYDDLEPEKRRIMKKEEGRIVNQLACKFSMNHLQRTAPKG